jgi:tetratricopeptide (TPR) repeat protein
MDVYAEPVETPPRPRVRWRRTLLSAALAGAATCVVAVVALPRDADPGGTRVQSVLALYGAGDRAGARAGCDLLLRELPAEPRAWLVDGVLREDAGDLAAAESSYRRAFGLSADPAFRRELEVSFAELRRRRGDAAGALAELTALAPGVGDEVRLLHARALCLLDLGRLDEALNAAADLADKPLGAGVARRLERVVRARRDAPSSRGG